MISARKISRQKPELDDSGKSKSPDSVVYNTVVREGDSITFDPTGEELKITKIKDGTITIEKLP